MARAVEWRDEYNLGNDVIDLQHRHIIAMVDAIAHASEGSGVETVDVLLEYFERLLRLHFETEEGLLQELGYPYLVTHAAEHARVAAGIAYHVQRCRETGLLDLKELLDFLTEYVNEHALGADREFGPFLHPGRV
jgi:hemerythrin